MNPKTKPEIDPMQIAEDFDQLNPSHIVEAQKARRGYTGQPHTWHGERGREKPKGLTFRDIFDCFIIGAYRASGIPLEDWPDSIYDLPWDEMDPLAVAQNQMVAMEERMSIYPNIPRLEQRSDD